MIGTYTLPLTYDPFWRNKGQPRQWRELEYGRYIGHTLPYVILHDPDRFYYCAEKHWFSCKLDDEAEELAWKGRRICIPDPGGLGLVVDYVFDPVTRKIAGVLAVDNDTPPSGYRLGHFDLSLVRVTPYDKGGNMIILSAVREHVFGDRHIRLTERRCAEFFDDNSNFGS